MIDGDAGVDAAVPRLVPGREAGPLHPGHRLAVGVVEGGQRQRLEAFLLEVALDADELAVHGGGGAGDRVIEWSAVHQAPHGRGHGGAARGEAGGPAGEVARQRRGVHPEDVLHLEAAPDPAEVAHGLGESAEVEAERGGLAMASQGRLPDRARVGELPRIDHRHAVVERGRAVVELDRFPHASRRDRLGRHIRGIARGLFVGNILLILAEPRRARRRPFAADVIREELLAVAAEDVDARGARGVDPVVRLLHAPAVDVVLAPLGGPLGAAAGEDVHAEVGVGGMVAAHARDRGGVVRVVVDRVRDPQRAGARDVVDEALDEGVDLVAVADGVDDGDALRRREIVRGGDAARERDPRRGGHTRRDREQKNGEETRAHVRF